MQVRELERLKKEERERAQKERADRFWACFLFTENGKVKSTLLLYSFCLCFVFLAVYGAAYAPIVEWLDPLLAGHPVALVNFVEAAVPTLVSWATGSSGGAGFRPAGRCRFSGSFRASGSGRGGGSGEGSGADSGGGGVSFVSRRSTCSSRERR